MGYIKGEIRSSQLSGRSDLSVELRESQGGLVAYSAPVAPDGSFELRRLGAGFYRVRIVDFYHEIYREDYVNITPQTSVLVLSVPDLKRERPISGVISAAELRIPSKAKKAFLEAQRYSDQGNGRKAIGKLKQAVTLHPGYAEAYSNMGVQFIRAGQCVQAAEAFQRAVTLMPRSPVFQANLAVALLCVPDMAEAESAARRAVQLDGELPAGHFVLGASLASQPGKIGEAIVHLRKAAPEIPRARLIMAELYAKLSRINDSRAELREYLKSGAKEFRHRAQTRLRAMETGKTSDPQ